MTKQRLYEILESTETVDGTSRRVNQFIFALIILNVCAVVLQTVEPVQTRYASLFALFEILSVLIFSLEFLLRVWVSDLKPRFQAYRYPRLRYLVSVPAIIDLAAVLPFFLPLTLDLRHIRVLRLFMLVRVMKLGRYSQAIHTMNRIVQAKREELVIAVSLVLVLLLFASTLMYALENEVQPEAFASIPQAMWWGMATLTTIGYGDVYPITGLGKFFGALIAIFCLGLFALPAGIIAGGFAAELQKGHVEVVCPHCGGKLES